MIQEILPAYSAYQNVVDLTLYLDSMGGAAVTSHKEQYKGAVFLIEQAAMRAAEPSQQKEAKTDE